MSSKKPKVYKISSVLLSESDKTTLEQLSVQSGAIQSVILRGLIRAGINQWRKKKIPTLEVIRLGAYSET